jgi:hypothetical protein
MGRRYHRDGTLDEVDHCGIVCEAFSAPTRHVTPYIAEIETFHQGRLTAG